MQRRCPLTRTEFAAIIEIHAIGEMFKSKSSPSIFHLHEEFILAVKATLRIVTNIIRLVQLAGLQNVYRNTMAARKGQRSRKFLAWQRWRIGDHCKHAFA